MVFTRDGSENLTSTIVTSGTTFTVQELNLTATLTGIYDVIVTNPGGLTGNLSDAFTVTGPGPKAPVVLGVVPESAPEGTVIPVFSLTGQNLGSFDTVDFISGGTSALSLPATLQGDDLIISNLSLTPLFTGTFDLKVTNTTTGLEGRKEQAFSVIGNLSDSYLINSTMNEYAILRPTGLTTVKTGDTMEYTLQARAGAGITNLTVDARQIPVPADYRYSFTNVTANHTIHLNAALESGVVLADFKGNVTSGTAPLTVRFTDASGGNPDYWSWTFGDGQISSLQNPVHTYTKAGTYTVSLYARNAMSNNTKWVREMILVTR